MQEELGLLPADVVERRRAERVAKISSSSFLSSLMGQEPVSTHAQPAAKGPRQSESSQRKAKSKMAKQSRKKNRKR